jgi:hypothetical protein
MSTVPSIVGVAVVAIDLVLTLPTTRKDGTKLGANEIQSVTVMRDSGTGAVELKVLPGPFNGATALYTDASPATGNDIYSFFVTDTAGTRSDTSAPVMVTVSGAKLLAAPAVSTLTAIAKTEKTDNVPEKEHRFSAAGGWKSGTDQKPDPAPSAFSHAASLGAGSNAPTPPIANQPVESFPTTNK